MRISDLPQVRSLQLFESMSESNFETLMQAAYLQTFPSQLELIHEGDPADFLYIVIEGCVELFARSNGRETTMALIRPVSTFILAAVLKAEPRNADALNLMGYSNRKMNRFPEAERWYQAALKANPKHLGALEYQGELYVEMGEYAKARANLDRLAALCGTCEEYTDLQTALLSAGQG